ncbi:MAG: hypothetical protein ACRC7A_08870, partial [Acinetobacter junii]
FFSIAIHPEFFSYLLRKYQVFHNVAMSLVIFIEKSDKLLNTKKDGDLCHHLFNLKISKFN